MADRVLALSDVSVVLGDITLQHVDAIVNAANEHLIRGGGVDGAIHEAAGERELSAACAALGGCRVGDAKMTSGFALPARYVLHAVARDGPVESGTNPSFWRPAIDAAWHWPTSST